jgi:hypothetical protein
MEPSDYKHVALGLIFLKHISDGFELKRQALLAEYPEGAEDPDEYLADNIFWAPQDARWSRLQANAKQPTIGRLIDSPMRAGVNAVGEMLKPRLKVVAGSILPCDAASMHSTPSFRLKHCQNACYAAIGVARQGESRLSS